jgi:hypothetical protein
VHRFALVLLALACAALSLSCERRSSTQAKPTASTSAEATSSSAQASASAKQDAKRRTLCDATSADHLDMRATHATNGDVLVVALDDDAKVDVQLHELAREAMEVGAESTHLVRTLEVFAATKKSGIAPRVLYGLEPAAMARFTPQLAAGRMPKDGESFEVVLSTADARNFGVKLGDELLVRTRGSDATWRATRLVGLLAIEDRLGTGTAVAHLWTSAARTRTLARGTIKANSLAVFLPAQRDRADFLRSLSRSVKERQRALSFEELQAPTLVYAERLGAVCKQARPAPHPALPLALRLPRCDTAAQLPTQLAAIRRALGDALVFAPDHKQPDGWKDYAIAKASKKVEPALIYDATLLSSARAFPVSLTGWPSEAMKRLEPHVVMGALKNVTVGGGVVLHAIPASLLGLQVGDRVQVLVTASDAAGASAAKVLDLEIAALVRFDVELADTPVGAMWLPREVLDKQLPQHAGRSNAVTVWADPDDERWKNVIQFDVPGLAIVHHDREPDSALTDALDALCKMAL